MGLYLNPNGNKEQWLEQNGMELSLSEFRAETVAGQKDTVLVVLVDNGPFTAAAVMFDDGEKVYWQSSIADDPRRHRFFMVERALAQEVAGSSWKDYMKGDN